MAFLATQVSLRDVVTLYESEIYEYCIVVRPDIGINEMDNKIISVNF